MYSSSSLLTEFSADMKTQYRQLVNIQNEKYGPMPNMMATLTNIGDALCSTLQSLVDAHY